MVVPLPPPVHGSNLVNQFITENELFKEKYELKVFPLHYASSNEDIGKRPLIKMLKGIKYYIRFFLLDFRPDIIYFMPAVLGLPFYRDFVFSIMLKMRARKLILHLHVKGIKAESRNILQRIMYRYFFKGTFIIHLSRSLLGDLEDFIEYASKTFVLPNGLDVGPGSGVHKSRERGQECVNLLFLSNLLQDKGPLLLLDAVGILKDCDVNFMLHIVGDTSPEISRVGLEAEIAARGLDENVLFHGPKYGHEKNNILAQADIFVFPTRYKRECFPLVLLEAMAYGLPIVSTNEGGISEIVDDNVTGFIVEERTPVSLADKLELLIKSPEKRMQMGRRARRKYRENYTLERFNSSFVEIVDAVVEERPT
jgi:glycosyltransferase involved in cell wall biosynthesis